MANPGLPKASSVVMKIPHSPGAAPATLGAAPKYQILRTNEVDAYESKIPKSAVAAGLALTAGPPGDDFKGTSRKASKLSIADASTEKFTDLADLIATLQPDKVMKKKGITTASTSKRIAEEKRNVRVDCFLYAASVENDNDYHLILGRDPDESDEVYMTMELSGLPPSNMASFTKLKAARAAFKKFFKQNLPGKSYDFYDPPVPVRIEGSLFWDANHATGGKPGPQSLRKKIPNVWEVHPIAKITFEP